MDNLGVVDHFLNVFIQFIDTGFGLLGGEVHFLAATLIAIDLALAGVFWALGGGGAEDVLARLIRKVLYIGAFAFIIGNFNVLATVILQSFARLGLLATASPLTANDLFSPGHLAVVGVDAARPIMDQVAALAGFPEVFVNLGKIAVMLLAWVIVILSFFILAVQMFITILEFKLSTLAGFVLVPFALWNKTSFLAERVLGHVMSSGIKVLVLAVVIGIGTTLFDQFTTPPDVEFSIDHALALMLASLCLFGLGIFGPGIATGLVSGAPQLGAGTAVGTALAAGGLAAAGAGAVAGGARIAGGMAASGVRTGAAGYGAFKEGVARSGTSGAASVAPGIANVAREGASHLAARIRRRFSAEDAADAAEESAGKAQRASDRSRVLHNAVLAAHVLRSGDHAGHGANPSLKDPS